MGLITKTLLVTSVALVCGGAAVAQDGVSGHGPCYTQGKPYSAVIEVESVQTLENGARITRNNNFRKVYRDSEGRTREESYTRTNTGGEPEDVLMFVDIHDPITETSFELNPQDHTARQFADDHGAWPRENPCPTNAAPTTNAPKYTATAEVSEPANGTPTERLRRQSTIERLGTQQIEGLDATGTKRTMTYPAGAAHNDQAFDVVTERWFSTELGVTLLSKTNDPRSGERTQRMTNIERSEPDPALFQLPADYKIVKDSAEDSQQ